ncbi:efflux RND transporter permease subunit [Gemmata sp.]|uniref:efflux RND transporter permease subunit n=1 Tax=Gemmata sp. TaxID=1914242 RepID=UPI003F726690
MNPIAFALRQPVTVMVGVVALACLGGLAASRLRVDIFPALNQPVVYVVQPYGGMDPQQMEGLIANYYEYQILYVSGIKHVETRNAQGVCMCKLVFHPGTDMGVAMAEVVATTNRARAFMPPGTVSPFITRFDTGSVPVGYLVMSSETKSIAQIQDQALFKVRPMFAAIPGVSAPPPFGGGVRTVVVRADPDRLRAYDLSADDVVRALATGNAISPSGVVRVQEMMPVVPTNALVVAPADLGEIEVKPGVYLRDVLRRDAVTGRPLIDDASDIQTGAAVVNGRRAVYIPVTKRADASTLAVVEGVKANLPKMRAALPDDIAVGLEMDQSPHVTEALKGVAVEAGLAAGLVGLIVLLFLRDWRSVVVVVLNIPLALTAAVVGVWLSGNTVNLMTLGGLALAVGVLVDESTVEVENIHVQMGRTDSVALAVRRGNADTAVPRLLAMLCVLAVFAPAFFLTGAARELFAPLALTVGFAMVASYALSSTFVPVACVWLLRHRRHAPARRGTWFGGVVRRVVAGRWAVAPAFLLASVAVLPILGPRVGEDIFPQVDAGQFQFRLKAPAGTRLEQTEALANEALEQIKREAGGGGVALSLGYVGMVPTTNPVLNLYLWSGGPEQALVRVALEPGRVPVEALKARLRETLPGHLRAWAAAKWKAEGVPADRADRRAADLTVSFEPSDIVNQVMSFGSPTPIEVAVSGSKMADNRAFAAKLREELGKVPALRDLQYTQSLDYPTADVRFDRLKLATAGVTADQAARAVVPFTWSSRFTAPNYWRDPASGVGYQVQVEVPQTVVQSLRDLELIPVAAAHGRPVLVRDVGDVKAGTMPGEVHRFNMRRTVTLQANVAGEDLGSAGRQVRAAIRAAGAPPAGVQVEVRGQIAPLDDLFEGLGLGLAFAVAAVLLMLTAYFQSVRLALVSVAPVPAVLAGVLAALLATGSTLNLQSFMGAITAVGVATANAILLVTFAERARRAGAAAPDAAVDAARSRARPILMTGAAMIAGMVPMAVGEGQSAPLGRAVVGGLLAATFTTLFVLPAVFALVMGRAGTASASLDPYDPASRHSVPAQDPVPGA